MFLWFIPKGLPTGYTISSVIDSAGYTVYVLNCGDTPVAENSVVVSSHKGAIRKLRRAAWARAMAGVVR